MTDAVRRWLMLQQELGGDEIIFDVPVDVRPSLAPRRDRATARNAAPAAVVPPVAMATGPAGPGGSLPDTRIAGPAGETADWRKGAPPIPGPGLIVTSPVVVGAANWGSLDEIATWVRNCQMCPLCRTRTNAVPGEGNPSAGLFLVGEGPGESEDLSGRPFVGRAGELLDKMLAAIEIPRADVYIANVVKCRPPKNRVPLPDEREACLPYLRRQIELVRPRVLVALGGTAAESLLGVKTSLGQLRLKVHQWNGIPLIVTYHPAALLRNPNWKRPAWDDVRITRQLLDRRA